jgi:transposase-like protein
MRKSRDRKGTASATPADTRRRWTAEEKAQLVRQHLRDGVAVAALAEQSGAAPSLIHSWIKLALERLDLTVDDRRTQTADASLARVTARKDAKIRRLEEVVVELATEVLTLKNGRGAS